MKKLFLLSLCLVLGMIPLFAKEIGGVSIPDTLSLDGGMLKLNGAGLRTKLFFKVYAGGLYTKEASKDAAAVTAADEPMGIRLHFLMDVDAKNILDAWNEGFKNSTGGASAQLADKITQFNSCFAEDSKKGTIYDIHYIPGEGLAVSVNGTVKAKIPGLDFKRAVFGIWLGEKPADKDLKKGMLGL